MASRIFTKSSKDYFSNCECILRRNSNLDQVVSERKPLAKKAKSQKSNRDPAEEPIETPGQIPSTHNSVNLGEGQGEGIEFDDEKNTGDSEVQKQIDARNSFADAMEHLPDLECEPPIPLITMSTDKTGKDIFKTSKGAIEEL